MGLVRNLLGQTFYPDNEWTRARDGSPLRPYDTATHTMAGHQRPQIKRFTIFVLANCLL